MKEYIEKEKLFDCLDIKNALGGHYGISLTAINAIPAADVAEVRHGKWVWDENGLDWGLGAWECSECHRKPETWWEAYNGNPYRCAGSSYCNNCGAKMDGGRDK